MAASWSEFAEKAPDLAAAAEALFARFEVVILGTTSRGGHPRLFLVEPRVMGSRLVIGTHASDAKALDLRRDPYCALHSLVGHRTHEEPVFKANLAAREIAEEDGAGLLEALARPEIRWRPSAAFELRLRSASVVFEGGSSIWHQAQRL